MAFFKVGGCLYFCKLCHIIKTEENILADGEKMEIDTIVKLCKTGKLSDTNHIMLWLVQRNRATNDVENALLTGEIIETYEKDQPYPSCLVLGLSVNNECLHIVCGIGEDELWLITAYYPNYHEWEQGFRMRKVEQK